jgi:hypothetical protein
MSNRRTVVLLLSLLLSSFAVAQTSLSGAIAGTAWDAQHAAVPEARITLLNTDTGERFEAVSRANGAFRIVELRPGSYSLSAQSRGFADYRARVTVEVGRITNVEIGFIVAAAHESIEVRDELHDEAPSVNTSQPDFATNLDLATIENLPFSDRRWFDFALLTPTATLDGDYGLISFRGISGLLNSSTIDGSDNNQAFFSEERGRSRISYVISPEAVREFQINTSNFSAQYGRSAGAVVNAVTHSGGNQIHGLLLLYDRDNTLGAANAFTVAPLQQPDGEWTTAKIKPLDRRLQLGADLGGPIVKDKLFYFVNFHAQHRNYPAVAAADDTASLFAPPCVIPSHYVWMDAANQPNVRVCTYDELYTLTRNVMPLYSSDAAAIHAFNSGISYLANLLGPVPRTADHNVAFSKIDYHLDPHQVLGLTYNRMRWSSPGGAQSLPVENLGTDSFAFDGVKVDMLTALLTSTIGNHTASQLRYSWSRDFEYQMPRPTPPGDPSLPNALFPSVSVLGDSSGFTFGTPATLPRRALPDEYRNQIAETVNWMHGRHAVKFGFDASGVRDEMNNLYAANGSFNYYYRDNFIADLYQWQNNTGTEYRGYSTFTQGFGTPACAFNTFDGAGFVQDDWRAFRRLTLSFGLRYDFEKLPSPQIPNPLLAATSSFPSDNNNFGPRFGFAWNVDGEGKTALRGGYGIFYARISNSTISSAISNTGTQAAQRSYSYRACYMWAVNCLDGPIFPLVSSTDPFSPSQSGNVAVFAPNMRTPQIHQADLVLEHQIAHNTVITASYLLSLGRELPNFIDINLDPNSRTNVTYTFATDYENGAAGPYLGHTLTVPVYTARINPDFQTITQIRSNVNSSYNALVLQFNRASTRALAFRLNYTWSHALDFDQNSTTFTTYNNTLSSVPFTYLFDGVPHYVSRPDYGNSDYDVRQRLTGSLTWSPSFFRHSNRFLHATLDHWSLAPTMHLATGKPFSDHISGDAPIDTCAGCDGFMGTGGQYRLPFLGRDSFRDGNFYNVDLRLTRRILFGERHNLEFLAEAFNLFNHQNITSRDETLYTTYNSTLEYDSNFNTPTAAASTVYREREIQLGLRYHF